MLNIKKSYKNNKKLPSTEYIQFILLQFKSELNTHIYKPYRNQYNITSKLY